MIKLGLQRISRLLAATPLPWRAIHVAGTNGKGSICAHVSDMLEAYNNLDWRQASGRSRIKHARFTSPYLLDYWDGITIDRQTVSRALFDHIAERVAARNRNQGIQASEFELLTATAFEIFCQEEVDVAVVEVGVGGRLDATNVIGRSVEATSCESPPPLRPDPLVTAIASVSIDHEALLGNTLAQIATEKAGIIKPGVPVVCSPNTCKVARVLAAIASDRGSPLCSSISNLVPKTVPAASQTLITHLLDTHHNSAPHIHANATTAFLTTIVALHRLNRLPPSPSLPPLIHTLLHPRTRTLFPGRAHPLPIPHLNTHLLLDGAHNPAATRALFTTLPAGPKTYILSVSLPRHPLELLGPLLRPGDTVFAVAFPPTRDGAHAHPAAIVAAAAAQVVGPARAHACADVSSALRQASAAAAGGPLVATGSLYLVREVLRVVRDGG